MNEEELGFILVRQKDKLYELIDSATKVNNNLEKAEATLMILSELWAKADYEYKIAEVMLRIQKKRQNLTTKTESTTHGT